MIIIIIDIIIIIIMINILVIIINIIITIIIMIINMIINMIIIIIIIIIINCFGEVKKLLRRPLLEDALKKKKHEMQVLKASCVKKRATPRRGPSLVFSGLV